MAGDHEWIKKAVAGWKKKHREEREQMVKKTKSAVEGTVTCPKCGHIFVPAVSEVRRDTFNTQCPLCKTVFPVDLEDE